MSRAAREPGLLLRLFWLSTLPWVIGGSVLGHPLPAQARQSHAKKAADAQVGAQSQAAEDLLARGRAALSAKDYSGAERFLSQFYRQQPSPEGLYQLALLAEAQGRLLAAQDLMQRYLADPNLESAADSVEQKEAARVLAQKRPVSGRLNIVGDRSIWVFIDEHLIGALPLSQPLLVAPGEHKVVLEGAGKPSEDQVQVPAGRVVELRPIRVSGAMLMAMLPAVVLIDDFSGLSPPIEKGLMQSVEKALRGEHLSVLPIVEALEVVSDRQLSACIKTQKCQLQLAQKCQADSVLRLRTARDATSQAWRFSLELIDSAVEDVAAQKQGSCNGCSEDKMATVLREALTAMLREAMARPRGTVQIESTPTQAEVRVGERLLGKTPYQGSLWAGEVELVISRPGFDAQRTPIRVRDGEATTLKVTLVPAQSEREPAPGPLAPATPQPLVLSASARREPRPLWRLTLGGILGGGALLTIGFGAAALSIANTCVEPAREGAAVCRQIHDTTAVGAALIGTGALLGLSSALLIGLPGRARRPMAAAVPRRDF